VARIVPVGGGELDDLVAAGRVVRASVDAPFAAPGGPIDPGADSGELLSALRDEERW